MKAARLITVVVDQNPELAELARGAVGFADLIDSDWMLISVRRIVAQAEIEREKRLVELEALAGVDTETLGRPKSVSATSRGASL